MSRIDRLGDRLALIEPPPIISREDQVAAAKKQRELRPGALGAISAAVSSQWSVVSAQRMLSRSGFTFDPDWRPDGEEMRELTSDLPESYWDEFQKAISQDHALRIREQLLKQAAAREKLQSLGWVGLALEIGAAVTDPADIAISAAAGYLAPAALGFGTARKVQKIVRAGLIAGGTNAALEAILAETDPERDAGDVLLAAAFGFGVGGAFGSLGGKITKDAEFKPIVYAMERQQVGDAKGTLFERVKDSLSPKGQRYFSEQLDELEAAKRIDNTIEQSGLDPVDDAEIIKDAKDTLFAHRVEREYTEDPFKTSNFETNRTAPGDEEIADEIPFHPDQVEETFNKPRKPQPPETPAQPPKPPEPREIKAGDFDGSFALGKIAKTALGKARRSISSILGTSADEDVRAASTLYVDNALRRVDGTGQPDSAMAAVRRGRDGRMSGYHRGADRVMAKVNQDEGVPFWKRGQRRTQMARDAFQYLAHGEQKYGPAALSVFDAATLVTRAARAANRRTDDAVKAYAGEAKAVFRDVLEFMRRHGVPGAKQVHADEDYVPLIPSAGKVNDAIATHGKDEVVRLYREAIERKSPDIDPEVAERWATYYVERVMRTDQFTDWEITRVMSGRDPETLERILRSADLGLSEDQIRRTVYKLGDSPSQKDPKRLADSLHHRLQMDYGHAIPTARGDLGITDLVEDNLDVLVERYIRQGIGAGVANEVYRVMGKRLGKPIKDFAAMKAELIEKLNAKGLARETVQRDVELLEMADKMVRGIPLADDNLTRRTIRRVLGLNYIVFSGGFGAAQIPDFASPLAEMGMRTVMGEVPAFTRFVRNVKAGKVPDDDLFMFVEGVLGAGTGMVNHRWLDRIDDIGIVDPVPQGIDRTIHSAGRIAGYLSGAAPIETSAQRLAAASAIQKFWQYARSGRLPSAKRLATLGIDEATAKRIMKAMREEAEAERGIRIENGYLTGRRVARIDPSKWADQEAAALLTRGVQKWTERAVQRTDPGNVHPWLYSDFGRMLFQFRSFGIASWEKHLLHRIDVHDWQAGLGASYSLMMAGIVYTAQQRAHAIGLAEEDREKFMETMLTPDAIARASFTRSSFSSVLPGIVDTVNVLTGGDPLFNFRNSGLTSGFFSLDNNPTSALGQAGFRAVRGSVGSIRDGQIARNEAKAFTQVLPYRNVEGFRQLYNAFSAQFEPERRDDDR